uniref:Uncharacterized protein n=1 Tax=Parvoviridae sp. TaxID=1940570 RepID=A0A7D3QPN7_9VIRU|nr:MAG: hypothetical protein [Parvoviridae sp.]
MSGGKQYMQMREQWGRAKTAFIRSQIKKGRSLTQAQENWKKARQDLKRNNVHWPPQHLYQGNAAALSDKEKAEEDKIDRDNKRAERLAAAEKQKEEFKKKQEITNKAGDKRPATNLDETDPQEAGPSGISDSKKGRGADQLGSSTGEEVNLANAELTELTEEDLRDLDLLFDGDTTATTTPNRGNTMPAVGAAAPLPAPDANAMDTDAAPAAPAGPSPGQEDNMGKGGGGGGLAGAGNNQYFHGFAKSTVPRDPEDYAYVDTYRRPFQVHTQFPDPVQPAAIIYTTRRAWNDSSVSQPLGYQAEQIVAEIDHTGIVIPYFYQEAAMKNCDWNKPADHVAWQIVEYGFDCPNMRLNILNNPKDTPEDVAPAPPADARMWSFVDIHNDYGIPQAYTVQKMTHNNYFQDEDINDEDVAKYALPQLGPRQFILDPQVANAIATGRGWAQANNQLVHNDPHALYDMKRHPGYKEFILSEASFGASFKPNAPIVRFPHPGITTIDMGTRQSGYGYVREGTGSEVTMWQNYQKQEMMQRTDKQPDPPDQLITMKNGQLQYYIKGQSAYFDDMRDSETASASYSAALDQFTDKQVRPPGNSSIIAQTALGKVRTVGRVDVSDDGTVHAKHMCKRPPIFMIGLYKELEYRTEPKFWRYYLYGQINYWCKIKWFVQPNRVKTYLPIGLGGVYNSQSEEVAGFQKRATIIAERYKYRYTMKPILNSTAHEPVTSEGGDNQVGLTL